MPLTIKNPNVFKWHCSRCGNWNSIDNAQCVQCGNYAVQVADQFRLHNVLTAEEKSFYQGTAPQMLQELRKISERLQSIDEKLEGEQR